MKTIGYVRVSTEQQDVDKQKHLLLEYAHTQRLLIKEFISVKPRLAILRKFAKLICSVSISSLGIN